MKKRFLCLVLACVLSLSLFGMHASASSASGKCGKNLSWSLDNGLLTISGEGKMSNYQLQINKTTAPWWDYRHQIRMVVVEEGVTTIGDYAFCGDYANTDKCYDIISVTLPDSVTSIGESAFAICPMLETVQLGAGLKTIGNSAFWANEKLQEVYFPEGLTDIGEHAFLMTGMTEARIPRSVSYIGKGALGCNTSNSGGAVVTVGFTIIGYEGTEAENYYNELLKEYIEEKSKYGTWTFMLDNYPKDGTVYFQPIMPAAVNVSVNGRTVYWTDAVPFIDENNRTMVPLRAVAEALGLAVSWDKVYREASFTRGTRTIIFPIGTSTARADDGTTIQMDTAAVIVSDRTFAPVRYLAEFFGYTVGWDGATKTVLIKNGAGMEGEDWSAAYEDFVLNWKFLAAGQEYAPGTTAWGTKSIYNVYLYDMDGDGVPELGISNGEEGRAVRCVYLYTYDGGSVVYLGVGPTDAYYDPEKPNGIYGYFHVMGEEINCTLYEKKGKSIETKDRGVYTTTTWPKNLVLIETSYVERIQELGWSQFVSSAGV